MRQHDRYRGGGILLTSVKCARRREGRCIGEDGMGVPVENYIHVHVDLIRCAMRRHFIIDDRVLALSSYYYYF